jgi:hypothetical protein
MRSVESLDRRKRCLRGSARCRSAGRGSSARRLRSGAGSCSANGFRSRGTHAAILRDLLALPCRPAAVDSPRPRYRWPSRIADKGARDRSDRSEHHGAGHRSQRGVARALRERGRRREQHKQPGNGGNGLHHLLAPSINDRMLTLLYGQSMNLCGRSVNLSGSVAAVHSRDGQSWRSSGMRLGADIRVRSLRRAPAQPRCGSRRCWTCRIPWCRP